MNSEGQSPKSLVRCVDLREASWTAPAESQAATVLSNSAEFLRNPGNQETTSRSDLLGSFSRGFLRDRAPVSAGLWSEKGEKPVRVDLAIIPNALDALEKIFYRDGLNFWLSLDQQTFDNL